MTTIKSFKGQYYFLSNFYPCKIKYGGIVYNSSEAAFQAQKCTKEADRKQFSQLDAKQAKQLGRKVQLRSDWEDVKIPTMYRIIVAKFTENPELLKQLLETGDSYLIEGNNWGDRFWGQVDNNGQNHLGKILMSFRNTYTKPTPIFSPFGTRACCVKWVKNWFKENGPDCNAVIGISGGKDSTIAAAICAEALGKDRVIGVLMPNGVQSDIECARAAVKSLGIKSFEVNINQAITSLYHEITPQLKISEQSSINLPARIRMSTLYCISQSMNGRVINTCNLSEDYIGYSTRYGDAAGDCSPLSGLTTDEVVAIGATYTNLPDFLIYKTPTDGLCGQSDEEKIGFSYRTLNKYIRAGECSDPVIQDKIDKMHEKNLFKLQPMPRFKI